MDGKFDNMSRCSCIAYKDVLRKYEGCIQQRLQQKEFGRPMMWIGVYVAAASLFCSLAALVDALRCIIQRKIWFPCKYFTLNATTLTVMAVVTKIASDINNPMPNAPDQLVKLSSTVFLCIVMGNVMPSLGTMDESEITVNLIALGILVITIVVNVCIQLNTGVIYSYLKIESILVCSLTLLLFVILTFSALAVPATKQDLEGKYKKIHTLTSSEETDEEIRGVVTIDKLRSYVKRYWIMAETGNPQFFMARFATCSSVGVICFTAAVVLIEAEIKTSVRYWSQFLVQGGSDYRSTTLLILMIQTAGVLVGIVAPAFRWFIAVSLKWSIDGSKNFENSFTVEQYWIQRLVQLKESPIALRIRGRKRRRIVQGTKDLALNLCMRLQMAIVILSKTIRLISVLIATPFLSCCYYYHNTRKKPTPNPEAGPGTDSETEQQTEQEQGTTMEFSRYVLRLEGERKLPKKILKDMSNAVDYMICYAKSQQPNHLLRLISKSKEYKGVLDFDSESVECLNSKEPPNTWSLAIVTLASIAVALPNSSYDDIDRLVCAVKEGLPYIRLIEKGLDPKRDLARVRKTADFVWLRVELYWWWLDKDLRKLNNTHENQTSGQTLEILADIAKNIILEFKRNAQSGTEENTAKWPFQVLASNSMYRTSRTLLADFEAVGDERSDRLFEQLSVTIADIFAACLTNLPRVIIMNCYCSAIEKREEHVNLAARLLGETEEILRTIQQHQTPDFDLDRVVYVDEWRKVLKQENEESIGNLESCYSESRLDNSSDEVCIGIE